MSKTIKVNQNDPNQEYEFFNSTYNVCVRFSYDVKGNVVKTLARIVPIFNDKYKHDIKKIRFCKKQRTLEVVLDQSKINNYPSVTEMTANTFIDFNKGDVNARRIVYPFDENYIDKQECYKLTDDTSGNFHPEVRNGNIFTIN